MSEIVQLMVGVGVPANIAVVLAVAFMGLRKVTMWETRMESQVEQLKVDVGRIEGNIKEHLDNGLTSSFNSLKVEVERIDERCRVTHGGRGDAARGDGVNHR